MAGKQVTELDALPSFTDNSLLPVHNGAGLKKGLLSQLVNYLGTKFSNPNLLINPDFKINQRGNSTYSSTGAGATVDRWLGTNVKTVVNSDNTVSVTSLSGTGYYTQHEENISYGKHTYSIYVQAITGTVKVFYKSKDSNDVGLGTLKQGLNTFVSADDGFKSIFLQIASGSSVTLKYVKVEQGTVATPFVSPNIAEEIVKCRRYYKRLSLDRFIGVCRDNYIYAYIENIDFRKPFTVTGDVTSIVFTRAYTNVTVKRISTIANDNSKLFIAFECNSSGISDLVGSFNNSAIAIDAEIY